MNLDTKRILSKAVVVATLFCTTAQPTFGALSLSTAPLFTGSSVPPKVLLTISKDQQLYKKAYNDYSDLDPDRKCADGISLCPDGIETTYKHSIDYYGYFDSTKCYRYSNGNNRFEPVGVSVLVNGRPNKKCNNDWSGNFLNWITMARIDAVRKLLYGGLRSTDTGSDTVLERTYLPTDAHAWAKYYNPGPVPTADQPAINELTPFNGVNTVAPSRSETTSPAFAIPSADGDYVMQFVGNQQPRLALGDQIKVARRSSPSNYFLGAILDITNGGKNVTLRVNRANGVSAGSAGMSDTDWTVTNLSDTGISFCNLTRGGSAPDDVSQTNTQPPLMRVAAGNFGLWNANERIQCLWIEERSNLQNGFAGGLRSNGNQAALSDIFASAENPSRSGDRAGGGSSIEFNVRVQVCVPALLGAEKCKLYPSGNYKPIGLLQEYGDREQIHFGLMTGSHARNISGGVLRKNPGKLDDEVNVATDGTFIETHSDGTIRNPYRPRSSPRATGTSPASPPGIINTLNYMRIYGYYYGDGSYLGAAGDNCTYQLTSLTEDSCTSWGNPMSEVFFEAIRYFASPKVGGIPQPTSTYLYSNPSKDNQLGLPLATWTDPLSAATYCSNLNVLVFNASVSSNDEDLRATSGADINATGDIASLTNVVGAAEGIRGGNYFVGKMVGGSATPSSDPGFELCTPKTVSGLGDVSGICPEGPTTSGSYLIAGIAHHAHTKRIRADFSATAPPPSDVNSLKVTTYGVQLATNVPQLVIEVPPVDPVTNKSLAGKTVVIQPIYRLDLSALGRGFGGGGLVDMRIVRQDVAAGTGKVYVNWEDSEQGGDYDQDMWGTIEWTFNSPTNTQISVTTSAISASTGNPQGFGYAISGTTRDGPHFHSGIYGFNFTDTSGVMGCANCNLPNAGGQQGPTRVDYTLGAASGLTLNDPLWYAAKFGGFVDTNRNGTPDAGEWDKKSANGSATPDGIPDNYFLVTNPLGLEAALAAVFDAISRQASGTALAADSTSLGTLNALYQARFNTRDWTGQLLALGVNPDGTIRATPDWDAATTLNAMPPARRQIITFDDRVGIKDGVPFEWANVSTLTLGTELNKNPANGLNDGRGSLRLDYLRGDQTLETGPGAIFRARSGKLGDIVNSSPVYVGAPSANVNADTSYATFRTTYYSRDPMIYVGANDGMLHAFEADPAGTGVERLAYVPSTTFDSLNKLTDKNYVHKYYVDGTPEVQDAMVNSQWRTVLVSGVAGGGKGIFALDVTDPNRFSEANAASLVFWEFTSRDDSALGFTYGKPVIRRMANGKWAALVTGGYNNSGVDSAGNDITGRAYLFIIFLDGPGADRVWNEGSEYIKIPAGNIAGAGGKILGEGSAANPNGLAAPFSADSNGDGMIDYIYAGDLYGNLWKFDVTLTPPLPNTGASASIWSGVTRRVKLFQARDSSNVIEPITAQVEATFHPTGRGYMVTFGTGKYLELSDTLPPYAKSTMYGIWDKNDPATAGDISTQTTVPDRTRLVEQKVSEIIVNGNSFREVTNITPDWTTKLGWFMDLPTPGERLVNRPLLMNGRLIFVTNIPSTDTCSFGGSTWLMVISATTGARIDSTPVLDVTRPGGGAPDGLLGIEDKATNTVDVGGGNPIFVSGTKLPVGVAGTPTIVLTRPSNASVTGLYGSSSTGLSGSGLAGDPSGTARYYVGGQDASLPGNAGAPPPGIMNAGNSAGRVTWREILTK